VPYKPKSDKSEMMKKMCSKYVGLKVKKTI